MNALNNFEINILNQIQLFRNPYLDTFFSKITIFGDLAILWIVIAIIFYNTKEFKFTAKTMFVTMIWSTLICNLILKNIFLRTRPFVVNQNINLISLPPFDTSFPSGHTFFSFASVTCIFMCTKSKFLKIFTLVFAILISFSRIYLYFHYPSDVIFGALIGIIVAYVNVKYMIKREKNLKN
ncbi:MAG: phosphatase PAP2 family protein [Peptoniphilaceae bacterium]|nr:phosphatase PAP2 family protein [Peptoniphilaceae bacterium]MDD7383336.1 phosphatase PAP2 family protein [Peptoniphilaceae bacterium]MDY3738293.1 phosphatase PAP2 family protein [Peptoniphilaceae bacterium]